MLRKKAAQTWIEPIIPTERSFIKHDLLVDTGQHATILDISVVANPRMEQSHRLKIEKYGSRENAVAIRAWMGTGTSLKHLPIIISSRGLMYGPSGRGLQAMGFTTRDLSDLCLLAIARYFKCFDIYTHGT